LDNKRQKKVSTKTSPDNTNDIDYIDYLIGYYNDPSERNAFFHNMSEPLLDILRLAEKGDIFEALSMGHKYKSMNFVDLCHQLLLDEAAYTYLKQPAARRTLRRLYLLFSAVQKFVSLPNPPTEIKQQSKIKTIISWLVKQIR
jgi:hypothetical protein